MADPDGFDDAVAQFLREYFEAEPVGASFYGLTEWDGRLPDVSADGFVRREGAARRWLERFSGYTPSELAPDQRVDLALLQAHLGLQVATADFAHGRRYPTTYLENGGTIEKAQAIAAHESPRTTKLYDRTQDELTLDEIERIVI